MKNHYQHTLPQRHGGKWKSLGTSIESGNNDYDNDDAHTRLVCLCWKSNETKINARTISSPFHHMESMVCYVYDAAVVISFDVMRLMTTHSNGSQRLLISRTSNVRFAIRVLRRRIEDIPLYDVWHFTHDIGSYRRAHAMLKAKHMTMNSQNYELLGDCRAHVTYTYARKRYY